MHILNLIMLYDNVVLFIFIYVIHYIYVKIFFFFFFTRIHIIKKRDCKYSEFQSILRI